MSVSYREFLTEVLPYVRDCPEIAATVAVRNACIEFCDRSHWLLYHHDAIDIVADQSTYTLNLPDDTTVARVLDAWFNGSLLAPIGEDDLKTMYVNDWRTAEGTPAFYTHLDPTQIILSPTPQEADAEALELIVALRPSRASTTIDESVYERWAEYIGWGARARLHDINGQPFFDPSMASKSRAMFERGIGMATIERNRGLTRHVTRMRFQPLV